jgi:hypothetical protein
VSVKYTALRVFKRVPHTYTRSRDSSVGIATGCELDGRGSDSLKGQEVLLYFTLSNAHKAPYSRDTGVNRPGHEADHSYPSDADVKYGYLYLHSPIRLHGIVR